MPYTFFFSFLFTRPLVALPVLCIVCIHLQPRPCVVRPWLPSFSTRLLPLFPRVKKKVGDRTIQLKRKKGKGEKEECTPAHHSQHASATWLGRKDNAAAKLSGA